MIRQTSEVPHTPRAVPIARPPWFRWGVWFGGVALALGVLAMLTVPRWVDRRRTRAWKVALAKRDVDLARWHGLLEVGTCVRRAENLAENQDLTECRSILAPLDSAPELPVTARTALRALATARALVIPPVRAAIRRIQALHANDHDYVWWRLELGFRLEDLLDAAHRAYRSGADVAAAVRTPLATLQAGIRDALAAYAPIREMPAIDALGRTPTWTAVLQIEDNGEWNEIEHDNMALGPPPQEPEGCADQEE